MRPGRRTIFLAAAPLLGILLAADAGLQFDAGKLDANDYTVAPAGAMVAARPFPSPACDFTFTDRDKRYEIRYFSYRERGSEENYPYWVSLWAVTLVDEFSGDETSKLSTSPMRTADARKEFGADFAVTSSIRGGSRAFSQGYAYTVVDVFYRQGRGIVAQVILFHDTDFLKTQEFDRVFHSFRFK